MPKDKGACVFRLLTSTFSLHTLVMSDDTIAAIATPLGEGGLAVVRISGAQALAVADKSFLPVGKSSLKPSAAATHTIHIRQNCSPAENRLTKCCSPSCARRARSRARTPWKSPVTAAFCPRSSCSTRFWKTARGWPNPANSPGARFSTGGIDLAQAEAVADLIHSRTELALAAANEQLAGKLVAAHQSSCATT